MTLIGIILLDQKLGNNWLEVFMWRMRSWRQKEKKKNTMNNSWKQVSRKESETTWQCARGRQVALRQACLQVHGQSHARRVSAGSGESR